MQKPYTLAGGSSLSCDNNALGGVWSSGCSFWLWLQPSRTYWELGHCWATVSSASMCAGLVHSWEHTPAQCVWILGGGPQEQHPVSKFNTNPYHAWETSPAESPSSSQSILDICFVFKSLHQTGQPSVNRVSASDGKAFASLLDPRRAILEKTLWKKRGCR